MDNTKYSQIDGARNRRAVLGLRENWRQFSLLVAVNVFVGGMIGLERSILPLLAENEFGIASKTAAVSFIATFGLAWGIFPLFFASQGLELGRIATLAAIYPMVWGVLQLGTGWASDLVGRKPLIVVGMVLQGVAISMTGAIGSFGGWVVAVSLLGLGTALVYPTLLAAIGDAVTPSDRATSLGVYRFWRDAGFMVGALAAGALADLFGFGVAIQVVAALTVASGIVAATTMKNTRAYRLAGTDLGQESS